jgi:hypothetical protein
MQEVRIPWRERHGTSDESIIWILEELDIRRVSGEKLTRESTISSLIRTSEAVGYIRPTREAFYAYTPISFDTDVMASIVGLTCFSS